MVYLKGFLTVKTPSPMSKIMCFGRMKTWK